MSDPELSKRIDDLHRRFDDFRADQLQLRQDLTAGQAALRQEIAQLRQDLQAGDTSLRQEMVAGFARLQEALDRRFTLIVQVVIASMTLLALLMTAYRFLQL